MASYYVRSGAAGAGTGADWANAYTTLAAAISGKAAGDIFYVSEDHAETTAGSITLTFPGTVANPNKVICADHAGTVPPVAADLRATAAINSSGANSINLGGGGVHCDGVIFQAGVSSSGTATINVGNGNNFSHTLKNCSLRIAATGSTSRINWGSLDSSYVTLENTTVSFANAGQAIKIVGKATWSNTPSALLGTIPTTLFISGNNADAQVAEIRGIDLSAAGSGKTIVGTGAGPTAAYTFIDCKLNAAVTLAATPSNQGAAEIDYVRSGSSGNYRQARFRYSGTLIEETTIVRTGGASDGTTPIAWKIVTTANAYWTVPFEAPPIAIWNDTTGSPVTATIEGIWGGGAVPNDDEIWVEAEYLGDASSPQGSFVNDSKANVLSTAAGQAAGSGTWGGSTTKFKLEVTFTPQQKGLVLLRVKAAKVSSTFYVDPKVTLS